jgi:hypothetical protein
VSVVWLNSSALLTPLQALHFFSVRPRNWLGVCQGGKGLVALGRQQEAFEIATKATALGASTKEIVEVSGVAFQWARSRTYGRALGHGSTPLYATIGTQPSPYFNKVPLETGLKALTGYETKLDVPMKRGEEALFCCRESTRWRLRPHSRPFSDSL